MSFFPLGGEVLGSRCRRSAPRMKRAPCCRHCERPKRVRQSRRFPERALASPPAKAKPFIHSGTKGHSAVPPGLRRLPQLAGQRHSTAITGAPGDDYSASPSRSFAKHRRVGPHGRSRVRLRRASTSLSLLAAGTAYYSCFDLQSISRIIAQERPVIAAAPCRWTQGDSNPRPSQCH